MLHESAASFRHGPSNESLLRPGGVRWLLKAPCGLVHGLRLKGRFLCGSAAGLVFGVCLRHITPARRVWPSEYTKEWPKFQSF
jgi:hypothetical protein